MPKKADFKLFGIVMGAVLASGFVMYQLRDNDTVDQIRSGFGG